MISDAPRARPAGLNYGPGRDRGGLMARIIVIGGGVVGMCGALLLGRDGHDVTVLERDPAPPPDAEAAWTDWERKGVNQFRMLHFFAPRFANIMKANAPEVVR